MPWQHALPGAAGFVKTRGPAYDRFKCFTPINDFPAAVQASTAGQIGKPATGTPLSDETKALILGTGPIQQVGTGVLDRAVRTLDAAIK